MKHNVMKIPVFIHRKLLEFGNNDFVAACTRQFKAEDVNCGELLKFGIKIPDAGIAVGLQGVFEPVASVGRFSKRNCRNMTVIHKDEPKVPRELEGVATDWHGGHHPFTYTRDCYRRSTIYAKHIKIAAQIIRVELDRVVVAFRVGETLNCTMSNFQDRLLAGLNLLQENVGTCNIELAITDMSQYQHLLRANWRIFPPGTLTGRELACRLLNVTEGKLDDERLKEIQERYDFLMSLGAKSIIVGIDSFHGYIGAKLDGEIIVFDNVKFGNAVYILRGDWESLSKKTKRELWSMAESSYRIQHIKGWKKSVRLRLKKLGVLQNYRCHLGDTAEPLVVDASCGGHQL